MDKITFTVHVYDKEQIITPLFLDVHEMKVQCLYADKVMLMAD